MARLHLSDVHSIEIPYSEEDLIVHNITKAKIIHKLCGSLNYNSPGGDEKPPFGMADVLILIFLN